MKKWGCLYWSVFLKHSFSGSEGAAFAVNSWLMPHRVHALCCWFPPSEIQFIPWHFDILRPWLFAYWLSPPNCLNQPWKPFYLLLSTARDGPEPRLQVQKLFTLQTPSWILFFCGKRRKFLNTGACLIPSPKQCSCSNSVIIQSLATFKYVIF